MKETDKLFESTIGNIGNPENIESKSSLEDKKLKHTPGTHKELNQQEQATFDEFLKKSRSKSIVNKEEPVLTKDGWIQIDKSEMRKRALFYPSDYEFYVRPATVEAIKAWSAIDESRIDVVNNVLNEIIKTCVKISSLEGTVSWNKLNDWDRFWFILKVREYTFMNGESKIEFEDTCAACNEEILFKLASSSLHYEFPDDDIISKHYDESNRSWIIDPSEYDIQGPVIKLHTPTLEKTQAIIDWSIQQYQQSKKIDEVFVKFLIWMLPAKLPKDPDLFNKVVSDCKQVYKSWDSDLFSFVDDVVRNITINQSEKLVQTCPNCGEEVISNVRFPNGISQLFKTETKYKKFGSR